MPLRFASELKVPIHFDEDTPAGRHFRSPEQLVRQNNEKQIGATVSHQAFKFRPTEKPILQGRGLAENAAIPTMTDGVEIVRIIFGKKRITGAQGGVVNAQMLLENIAAVSERPKPLAGRRGFAIIAAQIGQRLFAFENRGDGLLAQT